MIERISESKSMVRRGVWSSEEEKEEISNRKRYKSLICGRFAEIRETANSSGDRERGQEHFKWHHHSWLICKSQKERVISDNEN